VIHPHQLHASAAAWSLTQALPALAAAVRLEETDRHTAPGPIKAWAPSIGGGGSGHGDPIGWAALDHDPGPGRYARLARSVNTTLAWLAGRLRLAGEPIAALAAGIPSLRPSTAHQLTRWLRELDGRVRVELHLADERKPVDGAECQACGVRLLYRWPGPQLLVCMNNSCVCAGNACPCRMLIRAAGVAHIWQEGQ
jgi:hypothetical protein